MRRKIIRIFVVGIINKWNGIIKEQSRKRLRRGGGGEDDESLIRFYMHFQAMFHFILAQEKEQSVDENTDVLAGVCLLFGSKIVVVLDDDWLKWLKFLSLFTFNAFAQIVKRRDQHQFSFQLVNLVMSNPRACTAMLCGGKGRNHKAMNKLSKLVDYFVFWKF